MTLFIRLLTNAVSAGVGSHSSFFASIPNERRSIFEKQLTALYPDAHLSVAKDDYNIFNPEGVALGAYADSTEHEYYPLKTYTEFERDPLYVITNVFSKLKAKGEGASIQFIIGHADQKKYDFMA